MRLYLDSLTICTSFDFLFHCHLSSAYFLDSGSDMDLDKELHPMGYYINDREEMINQVFKVIKGPKLRAMLTSGLRDLDIKELKARCLTQLEGMSKKRIKYILAGAFNLTNIQHA